MRKGGALSRGGHGADKTKKRWKVIRGRSVSCSVLGKLLNAGTAGQCPFETSEKKRSSRFREDTD